MHSLLSFSHCRAVQSEAAPRQEGLGSHLGQEQVKAGRDRDAQGQLYEDNVQESISGTGDSERKVLL